MSVRGFGATASTLISDKNGRKLFLLALGAAAAVRLLVILFVPPGTDVFYYDRQAVEVLLSLQSPYLHHFTDIPASLATPGAENTFAYLPFTTLYLLPFYFTGDIRVGFIVADILIGVILYALGGGRNGTSLFYWFVPFTVIFSTIYLNNSLISLLFISIFVIFENSERRFLGALSFGIALSAIQFAWLLLPFVLYYYLRARRWKEPTIAVLVALALILPFFVAAPADFYNDVINFQFTRLTLDLFTRTGPLGYNLNLSLNGFLTTFAMLTLPQAVRLLICVALLPVFLFRMQNLERLLLRATGYTLLALFVLPNDFFWAYTELPFLLFLGYASLVWHRRSWTAGSPNEAVHAALTSLQVKPPLQIKT